MLHISHVSTKLPVLYTPHPVKYSTHFDNPGYSSAFNIKVLEISRNYPKRKQLRSILNRAAYILRDVGT
jgi:hypothetical protein